MINMIKISRLVLQSSLRSNLSASSCVLCQRRQLTNANAPKIESSQEVYYGVLTPQIRGVKMFSLMTSSAGVIAQPVLYQQVAEFGGGLTLTIALGSFIGFFTFVTPFLLHFITKKYVTRILYNPKDEKYTLTTLSFFLQPKTIEFTPSDVSIPDVMGMFTTFNVKDTPVFVDGRLFPDPSHYIKIMGYDKPVDFKLGNPPSSDQSHKPSN